MKNHFLVETVSAAGLPLACTVTLTKDGQELARAETDDNGIDRVSFDVPSSSLDVSASATCEGGLVGSQTLRLGQDDGPDQDGIILVVDGPTARVGEQVHVDILASRDAQVAYLDIIHAGLPILSVPVSLHQGEARYDLTVSSDYAVQWSLTSVPLTASRSDEARLISTDASLVAEALDWKVDSVADIEQAVAGMTLFDPWGRLYRPWARERRICLASFGPDEIVETNDDFTDVCARVRYRSDDHPKGMDARSPWEKDGGTRCDGSLDPDAQNGTSAPKLRKSFPETLFFRPSVITDSSGHARIDIPLADSITTWRVSAIASGARGALGTGQDCGTFPGVRSMSPNQGPWKSMSSTTGPS